MKWSRVWKSDKWSIERWDLDHVELCHDDSGLKCKIQFPKLMKVLMLKAYYRGQVDKYQEIQKAIGL